MNNVLAWVIIVSVLVAGGIAMTQPRQMTINLNDDLSQVRSLKIVITTKDGKKFDSGEMLVSE